MEMQVFNMDKFATDVYSSRMQKKLSKEKFAVAAGVKINMYRNIEERKMKRAPVTDAVVGLCALMGKDINEYFL